MKFSRLHKRGIPITQSYYIMADFQLNPYNISVLPFQLNPYNIPVLPYLTIMEMDLSDTPLVKYISQEAECIPQSNRYSRMLKAILPCKKSNKLRINENSGWNQDEDISCVLIKHDRKLDCSNEINDSIKQALLISQLQKNIPQQNNVGAPNSSPLVDDLTPPATPFGSSTTLLFDSNTIFLNASLLSQSEVMPLTPITPHLHVLYTAE